MTPIQQVERLIPMGIKLGLLTKAEKISDAEEDRWGLTKQYRGYMLDTFKRMPMKEYFEEFPDATTTELIAAITLEYLQYPEDFKADEDFYLLMKLINGHLEVGVFKMENK